MDRTLPFDEEEIERRLLARAMTQALDDPRPGIPHAVVREKLLKKMEELERKIASLLEE